MSFAYRDRGRASGWLLRSQVPPEPGGTEPTVLAAARLPSGLRAAYSPCAGLRDLAMGVRAAGGVRGVRDGPARQWCHRAMVTHRLLLESLPVSPSVSRLRAEGKITAEMTSVWIGFGAIELKREVRLEHRRFPNGGSWSFFLCPRCDRRVRRLRLNDGRPMCAYCCGNFHRISYGSPEQRSTARERRIEELRKLIDDGPARLNPRPGRVLDRRLWLTVSLRRAKIVKRWKVLRDLRAGKLPR